MKAITIKEYARSGEVMQRFAEVVGRSAANAYIAGVLLQVAERPELQRCDPRSVIGAALRAATMRLWVDPQMGHAYIVPFAGRATLIIGYKGLRELALRTNKYRHINAATIDDGEEVTYDKVRGTVKVRRLRPGSKPQGYLAYIEMTNGYNHALYMTWGEMQAHAKKYSKSYGKPDSPWTTEFDKMGEKTVLRLLLTKYGYLDPAAAQALANEEEPIEGEFSDLPDPESVAVTEEKPAEPRPADEVIAELYGEAPAKSNRPDKPNPPAAQQGEPPQPPPDQPELFK